MFPAGGNKIERKGDTTTETRGSADGSHSTKWSGMCIFNNKTLTTGPLVQKLSLICNQNSPSS